MYPAICKKRIKARNNLNRFAFITFKHLSQEPFSSGVILQIDSIRDKRYGFSQSQFFRS